MQALALNLEEKVSLGKLLSQSFEEPKKDLKPCYIPLPNFVPNWDFQATTDDSGWSRGAGNPDFMDLSEISGDGAVT